MADGNVPGNNSSGWTQERRELIRRTICPKGISEDEFALFLEQWQAQRPGPAAQGSLLRGAPPQHRQPRAPQLGDEARVPALRGRHARPRGALPGLSRPGSAVFAEDEIIVDQGKGEVVHRFNPAKRKGALVGAWSRVVRDGKLPVVVWLDFSGYVQTTPLWAKIPTTMIEKCARVAALRKAYPEAFGGLYVREEPPAEEQPTEDGAQDVVAAAPAEPARGMAGRQVHAERRAASEDGNPRSLGGGDGHVAAHGQAPAGGGGTVAKAPATAQHASSVPPSQRPAVVVAFGPFKGKTASELSAEELSETIDMANEKLQEQPKARWAKAMRRENLAALEAEVEFRCRVPPQQDAAAREPGSDG